MASFCSHLMLLHVSKVRPPDVVFTSCLLSLHSTTQRESPNRKVSQDNWPWQIDAKLQPHQDRWAQLYRTKMQINEMLAGMIWVDGSSTVLCFLLTGYLQYIRCSWTKRFDVRLCKVSKHQDWCLRVINHYEIQLTSLLPESFQNFIVIIWFHCNHIGAWMKWPLSCRLHLKMFFFVWKCLILVTEICSWLSHWWYTSNGLVWYLTHHHLDKMATILQTTFLNAFSWMKSFVFQFQFHSSLFPGAQLTISQHWFR